MEPAIPDRYTDLRNKYPKLYAQNHFFPGEGWCPLIDCLSAKLVKLIADEPADTRGDYYVAQVKEKFGGLRFYMYQSTDAMQDVIREAEIESFQICEECGDPGELRSYAWVKTLCDRHAAAKLKK